MSKYIVEISDKNRNRLKILVEFPIVGQDKWKILDDAGWIFDSGTAKIIDKTNSSQPDRPGKTGFHKHLNLCDPEKFFRAGGVTLWDFQGPSEVNRSGKGIIQNGWSLKASTGAQIINWEIV